MAVEQQQQWGRPVRQQRVGGTAASDARRSPGWAMLLWLLSVAFMLAALHGTARADSGHPRAPRAAAAQAEDAQEARVIVKFRAPLATAQSASAGSAAAALRRPQRAAAMAARLSLPLVDGRALGERTQAMQGRGLDSAALARRLAAQPDVEWAVVDQRRRAAATVPNDPLYASGPAGTGPAVGQWYLRAPDSTLVSATNAVGAWAITTGSPSVTVAVLDTGVRLDHPDLAGKLRPGYDFVSRTGTAVDGDGRDGDPSDPGDWSTVLDSCGEGSSSWHGTQVAGLIGAATDNGLGIAGLARNVMVLPVRVLGKCGGFDSDIIAGMRWAAGVSADPYTNPFPARVVNMSLGSDGACTQAYRDAMAELNAVGAVVVVAAGNDTGHAVNTPANCSGALAVAGLRHAGTKVGYSNIGPEVALAAPAGNCINTAANEPCLYPLATTTNSGTSSPGANTYSDSFDSTLGTSFATPLVAGAAALMLSVNPNLTAAEVRSALQATARAFPTTGGTDAQVTACTAPGRADQLECYCTTSTCGAGMLDVGAAVSRVQQALLAPSAVITATSTTVTVGQTATLSGTASTVAAGRSIAGWSWSVSSSNAAATLIGAINGSSVTLSATTPGTATVMLSVTDSQGQVSTTTRAFTIAAAATPQPSGNSSTSSGSSGGGALAGGAGWLWLGLLTGVIVALGRPARSKAQPRRR